MDIIYFGYETESSAKMQDEFIKELSKAYPDIKLSNAYDDIKGYRQAVYYSDYISQSEYIKWLISSGWFSCSFHFKMMKMDKNLQPKLKTIIIELKKEQPGLFKEK